MRLSGMALILAILALSSCGDRDRIPYGYHSQLSRQTQGYIQGLYFSSSEIESNYQFRAKLLDEPEWVAVSESGEMVDANEDGRADYWLAFQPYGNTLFFELWTDQVSRRHCEGKRKAQVCVYRGETFASRPTLDGANSFRGRIIATSPYGSAHVRIISSNSAGGSGLDFFVSCPSARNQTCRNLPASLRFSTP